MSFLDDMKMFGLIAMIIGLISLLTAVLSHTDNIALLVAWIIPPIAMLFVGYLAYNGDIKKKFEAVYSYLIFCGIALAISYILIFVINGLDGDWALENIIYIVVGIFAFFVGVDLRSGLKLSFIIWIILFLVFMLFIIVNLFAIIRMDFDPLLESLALLAVYVLSAIMSVYLLYFTASVDVRKRFN